MVPQTEPFGLQLLCFSFLVEHDAMVYVSECVVGNVFVLKAVALVTIKFTIRVQYMEHN